MLYNKFEEEKNREIIFANNVFPVMKLTQELITISENIQMKIISA
jgi:hypothetical protein